MSSFSIKCGPSHNNRRPSQVTLSGYIPKTMSRGYSNYATHTRVKVLKRNTDSNNQFSAYVPSQVRASVPQGSWRNKLTVTDSTRVQHKPSQPNRLVASPVRRVASPVRRVASHGRYVALRPCAYCHNKEDIHHIRDCSVLAEKNRNKAEFSRNHKNKKRQARLCAAEDRIREQVSFAQMAKETSEVMKQDTSGSEEEFPALTAAIASGHVTVKRGSIWDEPVRVSFNGDNENLMKPPCETKVFNTDDAPTSISIEEEEEIILKPSTGAREPCRSRTAIPSKEQQLIIDEIKDKEDELKLYSIDSWADACEIEELEEDIKALKAKLA